MKFKLVSVDPGKEDTKYAYIDENREIKTDFFKTRMTVIDELNDTDIIGENNYKVEFEGETFIIGSQGEIDSTDERSKKNDLHKIATLVGITKSLQPEEEKVVLINNIPATSYKSKELKKEYVDFYSKEKNIDITVNNIPYNFEMVDVLFMPETAGFVFKYPDLCKGRICVLDIGKYNVGLMIIVNGAIEYMTTLDLGGIHLENKTIERLEAKFDKGISRDKIIDYLKNGYVESWGEKLPESEEIISQSKLLYLDDIIRESPKKNVDLETMDKLHFIGGTTLLLKDEIEQIHTKLSKSSNVLKDSKVVSVIGNLLYGEKKYNGKK